MCTQQPTEASNNRQTGRKQARETDRLVLLATTLLSLLDLALVDRIQDARLLAGLA
jgi:hypothetical protein